MLHRHPSITQDNVFAYTRCFIGTLLSRKTICLRAYTRCFIGTLLSRKTMCLRAYTRCFIGTLLSRKTMCLRAYTRCFIGTLLSRKTMCLRAYTRCFIGTLLSRKTMCLRAYTRCFIGTLLSRKTMCLRAYTRCFIGTLLSRKTMCLRAYTSCFIGTLLSPKTMVCTTEVSPSGANVGEVCGDPRLFSHHDPLYFTGASECMQSSTVDTSSAARAAARTTAGLTSGLTSDRTRGSTPDLLLGFTPVYHLVTKANEHDWPSSVCTLMDMLDGSLTHSPGCTRIAYPVLWHSTTQHTIVQCGTLDCGKLWNKHVPKHYHISGLPHRLYGISRRNNKNNGIQKHTRDTIPTAAYVHCSSRVLNLCLAKAASVPPIRSAVTLMHELAVLFTDSNKRLYDLQQCIERERSGERLVEGGVTTYLQLREG